MRTNHTIFEIDVEIHTYSNNGGYISTLKEDGKVMNTIRHQDVESEKQAHEDAIFLWCELMDL